MTVDVAVRLGLQGGKEVQRTFDAIGKTGSLELRHLRTAANDLSPAMVAASRGVGILKDKTEELLASTGNIGKLTSSFGGMATAVTIGVAAVAAAATFAFSKAKEAAEFADNLDDTAARVGTNTDKLQELQYAIVATGGEAEDAATGLGQFNAKLGEARTGLGKGALKPFTALGFTKEEVRNFQSASDALPEIADRISKLGSVAEQNAVAEKLGIGPLLPLLREGKERFIELSTQAHEFGAVMDRDLVKKGADANQTFELASRTLSVQLKTAFVNLSPIIATFIAHISEAARELNKLLNPDSSDAQKLGIERRIEQLTTQIGVIKSSVVGGLLEGVSNTARPAAIAAREAEIAQLRGQLARANTPVAGTPDRQGTQLVDLGALADRQARAAAARSKADQDAKTAAAERARATAEYSRLIVTSLSEEDKAAFELKKTLEDLASAGAKAGVAPEEIKRQQDLAQAHYDTAKAVRAQTAANKANEESDKAFEEDAALKQRLLAGVDAYRDSPQDQRRRDLDALNAARSAARGLKGEFTDGEYAAALQKINQRYIEQAAAIRQATLQGQLMNGVLTGQIRSWKDLEAFAVKALNEIIAKSFEAAQASGTTGGGGFFSQLVRIGSAALGFGGGGNFSASGATSSASSAFGSGGTLTALGGRATGGPIYAGDRRWTGEQGPERISARSDGFVTDATTAAAAMRALRSSPRGGLGPGGGDWGGGSVQVTLNNASATPLEATARQRRDEQGRPAVDIDLVESLQRQQERRFTEMFEGKRDDSRFAASFGVHRSLTGN